MDATAVHGSAAPARQGTSLPIVLVCAVGAERRHLAPLAAPGVEILASGIGAAAARRRGEQVVERGAAALFSVGFCGALVPDLAVGDLIAADTVVDEATGGAFPCDPGLLGAAPGRRGTLVSAARLVRTPAERARLTGLACDMESAALADVAAGAGIPFLALRAVTDAAHHVLPDFDRLTDAAGQLTPGWGLVHFLLHPRDLGRLARLGPASRRAGRALAEGVEHTLRALA